MFLCSEIHKKLAVSLQEYWLAVHAQIRLKGGPRVENLSVQNFHQTDSWVLIYKTVCAMGSRSMGRTLYMDGLNWIDKFWDVSSKEKDQWRALADADKAVDEFVAAVRRSNMQIVLVIDADVKTDQAIEKWYTRREKELRNERRSVVLGVDIFLFESFQKHGVHVVRPIGADADDVLAALAVGNSGIVLSRDQDFFAYDQLIDVCRKFFMRQGKLILDPIISSGRNPNLNIKKRQVQLELANTALSNESTWSLGVISKYRPSLRNGLWLRGVSSSSDKTMGNLHTIARPLRAAAYSIVGEQGALEKVPEWCEETQEVVWTLVEVAADPTLVGLLSTPQAVVAWLEEHETSRPLEQWRKMERQFNLHALAAELSVVASLGEWTMHQCMELFSNQKRPKLNLMPRSQHAQTDYAPAR